MLQSVHHRFGQTLRATDGEIGRAKDFYFDDQSWALRYLVADTGHWLSGRLVLIAPQAFGHLYPEGEVLLVKLSRQQIEDSPSIDAHLPVSRQHEEDYHRHFGFAYYAELLPFWGSTGAPVIQPPSFGPGATRTADDAHLRSAREVIGYSVTASDGTVGEIKDFMVDGRTWVIRHLVIRSEHGAAELLIPTEKVSRVSYEESTVFIDSTRAALREVLGQHLELAGS